MVTEATRKNNTAGHAVLRHHNLAGNITENTSVNANTKWLESTRTYRSE